MQRLHGPLVSEEEIDAVVRCWKEQGEPCYEDQFLTPSRRRKTEGADEDDDPDDPAYEDAVRIVLEMGKASTSILQRRLRLGYGRAARILDAMEREEHHRASGRKPAARGAEEAGLAERGGLSCLSDLKHPVYRAGVTPIRMFLT